MENLEAQIETLKQWIIENKKIVVFSGAGMSTESGIPDYKSPEFFKKKDYHFEYYPHVIMTPYFREDFLEEYYRFYRERLLFVDKKPNAAHIFVASLERNHKLLATVTKNIDGLHQKAANHRVIELCGTIHENTCMDCGAQYDAQYVINCETTIPHCAKCGGIVKPNIRIRDEYADKAIYHLAERAICQANILIVVGLDLYEYPAPSLIRQFQGKHLIVIDKNPKVKYQMADLVIHAKVGEVFSKIKI